MSDYTETFTIMKRSPTSSPNEIGGVWAIGHDSEGKYFGLMVNGRYALLQRVPGSYVSETTFIVNDWRRDGTDLCLTLTSEDAETKWNVRMGAQALVLEGTLPPLPPERRTNVAITTEDGNLVGYYGTDNKPRLFERMGYKRYTPVHIPENERALVIPEARLPNVKTDADGVIIEIA